MRFIGITNTLLDDAHAIDIVAALGNLPPLSQDQEPETLEMLQIVFQPGTRKLLQNEANSAALLLSHPNGPALRGRRCSIRECGESNKNIFASSGLVADGLPGTRL